MLYFHLLFIVLISRFMRCTVQHSLDRGSLTGFDHINNSNGIKQEVLVDKAGTDERKNSPNIQKMVLEELENKLVEQDRRIDHLRNSLSQNKIMNDQATRRLRKKIKKLESRIQRQEDTSNLRENRTEVLAEDINTIRKRLNTWTSFSQSIKQVGINFPVAFSARVSGPTYDAEENQTIVFDTELMNDGNGYDKETGVFTAPISGVYVFSFFVVTVPYNYVEVSITVNGKTESSSGADAFESNLSAMGGNVVVLLVNGGEKVEVKNQENGVLGSWITVGFSTFSGFLLYVK